MILLFWVVAASVAIPEKMAESTTPLAPDAIVLNTTTESTNTTLYKVFNTTIEFNTTLYPTTEFYTSTSTTTTEFNTTEFDTVPEFNTTTECNTTTTEFNTTTTEFNTTTDVLPTSPPLSRPDTTPSTTPTLQRLGGIDNFRSTRTHPARNYPYKLSDQSIRNGDKTPRGDEVCVNYQYIIENSLTASREIIQAQNITDMLRYPIPVFRVQVTCNLPTNFFLSDRTVYVSSIWNTPMLAITSSRIHNQDPELFAVRWLDDKMSLGIPDVTLCLKNNTVTFTSSTFYNGYRSLTYPLVFTEPTSSWLDSLNVAFCQTDMPWAVGQISETYHSDDCVWPIYEEQQHTTDKFLSAMVTRRCYVRVDPAEPPHTWAVELLDGNDNLLMHCYHPHRTEDATLIHCQLLSNTISRVMYCRGWVTVEQYEYTPSDKVYTLGSKYPASCENHLSHSHDYWEEWITLPINTRLFVDERHSSLQWSCSGEMGETWLPPTNVTFEYRRGSKTVMRCEANMTYCFSAKTFKMGMSGVFVTGEGDQTTVDVCNFYFYKYNDPVDRISHSRLALRSFEGGLDLDVWMCPQLEINRPFEVRTDRPQFKPMTAKQFPILQCDYHPTICNHMSGITYMELTPNGDCINDLTFEIDEILGELSVWYTTENELAARCVRTVRELRTLRSVNPQPLQHPLRPTTPFIPYDVTVAWVDKDKTRDANMQDDSIAVQRCECFSCEEPRYTVLLIVMISVLMLSAIICTYHVLRFRKRKVAKALKAAKALEAAKAAKAAKPKTFTRSIDRWLHAQADGCNAEETQTI